MTKPEVLDLYFADARSKLIDLAAFLDRVERSAGDQDFRVRSFRAALSGAQHGHREPLRPLVDQAHAGDARFGLLKLGDVQFDDMKAALPEPFGGTGIAGGQDQPVGDAEAVRRGALAFIDRNRVDSGELRRIDRALAV